MARLIRCLRGRVSRGQESPRLLLIKPEELMLFQTGADKNAGQIAAIAPNVLQTLEQIDQTGQPPAGTQGGQAFQNREGLLPSTDSAGNPIQYKEWDVNPKGPGGPGTERLVTGSDGSAYYTPDHYRTFTRIR